MRPPAASDRFVPSVLNEPAAGVGRWPVSARGIWCLYGDAVGAPFAPSLPAALIQGTLEASCIVHAAQDNGFEQWGTKTLHVNPAEATSMALAEAIRAGSTRPLRAITGFNEQTLAGAAALRQVIGIPAYGEPGIDPSDKATLYQELQAARVPVARFHVWREPEDVRKLVRDGTYEPGLFVLKPARGSDSAGVYRAARHETVESTLATFFAACASGERLGTDLTEGGFIIMEYLTWSGTPVEVCVDGAVVSGMLGPAIVQEKLDVPDRAPFVDRRIVSPPCSPHVLERTQEILATAQAIVCALDIVNGVIHFEFRLTAHACIPIDCAVRPGGGYLTHAFYLHTGLDLRLAHLCARAGVGSPRSDPSPRHVGTAIGAVYALDVLPEIAVADWAAEVRRHTQVFALHEQATTRPGAAQFTEDAVASIGVTGSTSGEALAILDSLAAKARKE